jgi:putative transposase
LGRIVQWFKTMTTNDYIKAVTNNNVEPFPGKLWQRNYYEHITRNETDLNSIWQYIIDNPAKWKEDEDNPRNLAQEMK